MRSLNIYIWGEEQYNIYHLLDYVKNTGDDNVALFFLKKKLVGLNNQKKTYVFDYPEFVTSEWLDAIYHAVHKVGATSIKIHSAVRYAEKINLPLTRLFQKDMQNGLRLSFCVYEASLNDISYRQEYNNLFNKGLRAQEYIRKLKNKLIVKNDNEWNSLYNYLFNEVVNTQYYFNSFYLNANTSFFSAPHFHYANIYAMAADRDAFERVCSLLGVKTNAIDLIKNICEQKKSIFFIDDGIDYPLGEEDKDTYLLNEIIRAGVEFVFLINYTGTIDRQRAVGINFVRLPDNVTLELLVLAGVSPDVIYGICALSLFSAGKERVKKVFFHEHSKYSDNIRQSHFLRTNHCDGSQLIFIDETLNRVANEHTATHFFSIGDSMGDGLFAIGAINQLRNELTGKIILLAPAIYQNLLALCPYVDDVWDRENLDKEMVEAIYMAKILGHYHMPCSGTHIFAAQHQIDSILDSYGKKHVDNKNKEIVLSLHDVDKESVDKFIHDNQLTDKVVLIHPNEGVPNRTWPKQSWEELIALFLDDGWSVVLIGANKNFYSHKKTVAIGNQRVFNAIDKFSMAETVYLMTQASLLVACDSGPVALAAATDIAICALYSVVPGKYRLPFRHGTLGWNALAVNLSCQYGHCAKSYPASLRGTFDAWCPNNKTYSCIAQYGVSDFYKKITEFIHSKKYIAHVADFK